VVRERLLAKLSGANNYRLVLITSPAGYGKTTLISQWAAGKNDLGGFRWTKATTSRSVLPAI
jgi:LuxR family maltose regulon positive regulatory protein